MNDEFSNAMEFADDKRKAINWSGAPLYATMAGAGLLAAGLLARKALRPTPPQAVLPTMTDVTKKYALPAVGFGLMSYGVRDLFR